MQKIGSDVINSTRAMIDDLFMEHGANINQAYLNAEDALSVSIGVKYKPNAKTGAIDIDVSMSFTAEKITDSRKESVIEGQRTLFEKMQSGEVTITDKYGKDILEKE